MSDPSEKSFEGKLSAGRDPRSGGFYIHDLAEVKAGYEDGLLLVHLPKVAPAVANRIVIK